MKLFTIVSEVAWLSMLEKGYLICDDVCYLGTPDWSFAYEWMIEQMTQRIGPRPSEAQRPLWAWCRYYGGKRKDLTSGWGPDDKGKKMYLLFFEADKSTVLQSDFGDWHAVLNGSYLGVSEDDYDKFDAEFEDRKLTPEERAKKDAVIKASWQRIFDLDLVKVFGNKIEKRECIQACLWKIELSQVTKVQPYISTGYKWKTIQPRFRCLHDKIQRPFNT